MKKKWSISVVLVFVFSIVLMQFQNCSKFKADTSGSVNSNNSNLLPIVFSSTNNPNVKAVTTNLGTQIFYTIENGFALTGGDIILGQVNARGEISTNLNSLSCADINSLPLCSWSNGLIPFQFDNDLPELERAAFIAGAQALQGIMNNRISFTPRTSVHQNYIKIGFKQRSAATCDGATFVGSVGGSQAFLLNLSGCSETQKSIQVLHQLSHLLGLRHEHSRCDRDNFIQVSGFEQIHQDELFEVYLGKQCSQLNREVDLGNYDIESITQADFSDMIQNINAIDLSDSKLVFTNNTLSFKDLETLNFSYNFRTPSNGICGAAQGAYSESATQFRTPFCTSIFQPEVLPVFPQLPGQSVSWTCLGQNGGQSVICNAQRGQPVIPDEPGPPTINGSCGGAQGNYPNSAISFRSPFCSSSTQPNPPPVFPSANGGMVSWTCPATINGGVPATCTAIRAAAPPVQFSGVCGVASGVATVSAPSATNLCSQGTGAFTDQQAFQDFEYNWTCQGSTETAPVQCSAPRRSNGACGVGARAYTANDTTFIGGFCQEGSPTPVNPSFPQPGGRTDWQCFGRNGGVTASCFATKATSSNPAINGRCGPSDAGDFVNYPTTGLCDSGQATPIDQAANDGIFNWSCGGLNGGVPSNCSATKIDNPLNQRSCVLANVTILHTQSIVASRIIGGRSSSCVNLKRTCNDGTLNGDSSYSRAVNCEGKQVITNAN